VKAMTVGTLAGLAGWGTLVGIDLVSFPQALLSRPLIAGAGAGLILGEFPIGLQVGLVLELFALDVLPVGAARYPDYGPAVVGAVVLAAGGTSERVLGLATLFGLGLAVLGGLSLRALRQANGRIIHRYAAGLAAGDAGTIARIQYRGLAGDMLRSLVFTGFAIGLGLLLRPRLPDGERYASVTAVAVGCGVASALGGAIRSAGRGARLRWLAAGAGLGLLLGALR
jgi:mannose/fructose/N-acetylgalactosamine-specific phosphotransferase system component IIC